MWKERKIKRWVVALSLAGLIATFDRSIADDRSSFIIDMTHAFYAKVYCSGLDVVYEGFVANAKAKNLNQEIVEEVRNGVAFLNTNGPDGAEAAQRGDGHNHICRTNDCAGPQNAWR